MCVRVWEIDIALSRWVWPATGSTWRSARFGGLLVEHCCFCIIFPVSTFRKWAYRLIRFCYQTVRRVLDVVGYRWYSIYRPIHLTASHLSSDIYISTIYRWKMTAWINSTSKTRFKPYLSSHSHRQPCYWRIFNLRSLRPVPSFFLSAGRLDIFIKSC